MTTNHIHDRRHPLADDGYAAECRRQLDVAGALVLPEFFTDDAIDQAIASSAERATEVFYADSTHNVYLTPLDPQLAPDHPFNRQVTSTKGLLADDQIPRASPLREVYDDPEFRRFLGTVLGVDQLHPYADELSSVNVHFAPEGRELGWHFDNSSFAVTMLLQAPDAGGRFEYVPNARDADAGEMGFELVDRVLNGSEPVRTLRFDPGDLVLFRGRDALHRVTPTEGPTTRLLVVFAFNDQSGIGLSDSALATFYGRTSTS